MTSTNPPKNPAKPLKNPAKPPKNPGKPVESTANPPKNPADPLGNTANPLESTADPLGNTAKRPRVSARAPASKAPTYAAAGVDLDHDEGFIEEIDAIVKPTLRPEILSRIGGFAGMFKAPERYDDPVFVAGTDGVGTKLKLAAALGRYDTIGIDCVAMVVNDLVVQGAEPLVFLDYIAMDQLNREVAKQVLRGVAEGCRRAGCTLLGGETASMPGVYAKGDVELVGFGVGVVNRDRVIDGSSISHGDTILGLASSGFHSNGYALVRRIVDAEIHADRLDLLAEIPELNTTLASALLSPTRIYVKPLLNLMRNFDIKGLVHITGGGFEGNVPRVLPKSVCARIDTAAWPRPPIFDWIQRLGGLSEDEMLRVFNCGLGMLLVVPPNQADEIIERTPALGERIYRIGRIEARKSEEAPLIFGPAAASV